MNHGLFYQFLTGHHVHSFQSFPITNSSIVNTLIPTPTSFHIFIIFGMDYQSIRFLPLNSMSFDNYSRHTDKVLDFISNKDTTCINNLFLANFRPR